MRDDNTIGNILDVIDRIESDLNTLKALVQQAISKEQLGATPFVDATYFEGISQGPRTNDSILVDAEILEDSKPTAKPSTRERRLAAQQRAREWAKTESDKKQIKKP
jgi:cell division FtsZ-interacting protein ZapD